MKVKGEITMLEHSQAVRAELLDEVKNMTDEQLNQKPSQDVWSPGQILEHLYLMERVITGGMKQVLMSGEKKEVTEKPLELVIDRSRKVPAPENLKPAEGPYEKEELLSKLEDSRRELINFAETAPGQDLNEKAMKHPHLGDLSLKQWVEFIGYHEKRHLLQLSEVKSAAY
ncbi:DinB family protein [Metabacillus idriensis]|uniref:DinB family protein n=1 Tax=Metabacillus idriensis TaxID=324768 RepID=UPI002812CDF9|nr:DinB family protein [Metabacillus idriensis]MDR0140119.1 DinB family protein [Metabacillus idriensis]